MRSDNRTRSEVYGHWRELLDAYRLDGVIDQAAEMTITTFCQRHGIRRCAYCPTIDKCTALGLHCCANHYQRRRGYLWF